ncbi:MULTISPECIES: hypothetical protein [Pseudoalteromonas]|uniref:hypothetical protein n=1 Tax=Pseudoalteromonas TaxID=53246 RepID=UPI00036E7BAF|nr:MULTISPECIES: hypothetical protein [Pseudoalteromonas]WPU31017.1 hypothetical protein SIO17_18345 [Pseudoalteromonas piscicida]
MKRLITLSQLEELLEERQGGERRKQRSNVLPFVERRNHVRRKADKQYLQNRMD